MELFTFSYTIGAGMLLLGIPMLLAPDKTADWLLTLMKDALHVRLMGTVFFVLGFLVLVQQYAIGIDVAGFMRLVAWVFMLKGVFLAWWPMKASQLSERHLTVPALRFLAGFFMTIFGVLFVLAGNTLV